MGFIDKRTISVLCTVLLFTAFLALVFQARRPIIAFVFAILFTYLLEPIVTRLEEWFHGSRGLAIAATYLVLGAALGLFLTTAGTRLVRQAGTLSRELPMLIENIGSGQIVQQIGTRRGWDYATRLRLQQLLRNHRADIIVYAQAAGNRAADVLANLPWLLLIPILAVFLLKSKSRYADSFLLLVGGHQERRFLRKVLSELDTMLAVFIRAQLLLGVLSFAVYSGFLLVMGFPYALALGALGGVLEFVPVVGPLAAAAIFLGIAVLAGYPHWLSIVVVLIVWRVLQDYVTSPYLMGRNLELQPLAIIFGILVCGEVAGIVGIFFAVPIIASMRIIWKTWKQTTETKPEPSANIAA